MDLTENKDLFQTVFNSASNGIAVMQPVYNDKGRVEDFSILLFNNYIFKWIGDTDYKGKWYSELFPLAKQTGILEKFIEVAETGTTANFEEWYAGKEMNHWFRFTAVKQGELLIVTTEDKTEKKQAELLLDDVLIAAEQQKRLFDSITNNTPDLVYVFDLSYRFTYANKALLTMWGKSEEDAIGRGLRDNGYEEWHALMHEREIDEVAATKKQVRGTVSFPHAELGKRIYDYILTPVFNEQGEVEAVAGTTRDITELTLAGEKLQQSETRFRTMIEQSPIAMLLSKGEDVIIESINKPMLQFMNKNTAEEVLGKKMIDALPELSGQPALQTVIDVQRTGIPFRGSEQPVDLIINGKLERRYFNFSYDSILESEGSSAVLHMAVDVTEQVLARRKLEDSERRLRSMIDQTPCPTLILKGDNLIIEQINKHMLEMIGRGEEIMGMPLIDVLPELRGQYVWEQVEKVYHKGIPFDQSEVLVQHNRTGVTQDYYYNLSYRPLIEEGKITGMIQVAIDVTQQVVARKKMEESENRFRALVNASSDVVYCMNPDWTIMYNMDGRGFLSDTREPIFNWLDKHIHPDDREKVENQIAKSIADKSIFELEYRILNENGTLGWTFSRAIPILDHQNNILEWFGAASDTTSQKEIEQIIKQSEEKFRQLADLVPQIIWTSRADGHLDYYNKRWQELTGVNEKEAVAIGWAPFTHPDDLKRATDTWYGCVKSGELFQLEFRIKNIRTGEYQWFLGKAVPIKDDAGVITKWFGTCTDIQEHRSITDKLESLVAERTKELQRSNEDLQQFAHVASHDLKEPVRKIKTFTSRLEEHLEEGLDKTSARFIDRIHVATDRMFNMIDGVLAYSKINADLQKNTLVDLNEVIKNIETDLEVSLQKTGGKIHYHNLPKLEGALVLLYQLFYNLINNSIKFAKIDTPPEITILSETEVKKEGSFVVITLKDNGIGFEPSQAERIFETFTRLNSKDSYEGTGLGLSLCKKIVERHGGNISAIGSLTEGATFVITLPLTQNENDI
ncbi:PAS domain-containing protein [Flavobacterium sp. HTF]|uniref:PAS domain-containing sensor histidine kinase n=1 Tax=Flavobacterium sp. HTF TaxID=2170732 RepID=UPI000D5D69D9|nr:PAS domain-containing protein [Flavobacterium sp. HTF]PWB22394.1 PAS domain-containing sensor histidine kinase [Flavobacterium sp. HTF]